MGSPTQVMRSIVLLAGFAAICLLIVLCETSSMRRRLPSLQRCKYGNECKRNNPDHFEQFTHPPNLVPAFAVLSKGVRLEGALPARWASATLVKWNDLWAGDDAFGQVHSIH